MAGLRLLVFLGSTRVAGAPKPTRLGARVARHCVSALEARGGQPSQGSSTSSSVVLVDPLEYFDAQQQHCQHEFRPIFSYRKSETPPKLAKLAQLIVEADGFCMTSPEYNHSMSPALSNMLNHFPASSFAFKPSLIVSYSAGQWGGARAAISMRSFLSELGCLPVSAMLHLPRAQEVFSEDGGFAEGVPQDRWGSYMARGFSQLEWWAEAAKAQRARQDLGRESAFRTSPDQRDAPPAQ